MGGFCEDHLLGGLTFLFAFFLGGLHFNYTAPYTGG